MKTKEINLDTIRLDGGTQIREAIDSKLVEQYREAIIDGQEFPPVEVFNDGKSLWLADGFHRWHATDAAGLRKIKANIREGTQRDAILYAVGANATHGLSRSNADKRRAVMTLLNDEEWAGWTDSEIARQCGVHHTTVGRIRDEVSPVQSTSEERTYTTKHGTTATMKTGNIGKTLSRVFVSEDGEELQNVKQITTTEKTLKSKEFDPNEDAEDVGMGVRFNTTNKADSGTIAARKTNITGDKLTELRDLLGKLKELTDVPSMQLSPIAIRLTVKSIIELVG